MNEQDQQDAFNRKVRLFEMIFIGVAAGLGAACVVMVVAYLNGWLP